MTTNLEPLGTYAVCDGGPLDGMTALVPWSGPPILRGATLLITLDDTSHTYVLKPTAVHPFASFKYAGVAVQAPPDELTP